MYFNSSYSISMIRFVITPRNQSLRGCRGHCRGHCRGKPGMLPDLLQGRPSLGVPVQTAGHQLPGFVGDVDAVVPDQVTGTDLLVCLEGYVSVQHVVQEDPQAPHSEPGPCVLAWLDPLGRGVHPGAWELGAELGGMVPATAAKVYQLGSAWLQVNQNVFILKENFRNIDTR